jgi:hypothetical protein
MHPSRHGSMPMEEVRQLVRDDRFQLFGREDQQQRIADHQQIARPEEDAARDLYRAGIRRAGDQDTIDARRGEPQPHLLDHGEEGWRLAGAEIMAARLRQSEQEGADRAPGGQQDRPADEQRRQTDEGAAGDKTPGQEGDRPRKDEDRQQQIGVAFRHQRAQAQLSDRATQPRAFHRIRPG